MRWPSQGGSIQNCGDGNDNAIIPHFVCSCLSTLCRVSRLSTRRHCHWRGRNTSTIIRATCNSSDIFLQRTLHHATSPVSIIIKFSRTYIHTATILKDRLNVSSKIVDVQIAATSSKEKSYNNLPGLILKGEVSTLHIPESNFSEDALLLRKLWKIERLYGSKKIHFCTHITPNLKINTVLMK